MWLLRIIFSVAELFFLDFHDSFVFALSSRKMTSVDFLAKEKIWFDKPRYDEAERRFYEQKNGGAAQTTQVTALLVNVFHLNCTYMNWMTDLKLLAFLSFSNDSKDVHLKKFSISIIILSMDSF